MIGLTVCSGIGAPEVAAPWIEWRYQSEIEPFPRAVLAHRFPNAVQLGDMTKFEEWPDATVDVLVGGTPCQSFSVAGLRKGLDDPRGDLMLTFLAIARKYRPRWIVWENVPGVLSSNGGRDFGTFLGGLGECGYGWAYRVLDAQYVRTRRFPWAVPQRRRRVFVVGCLGNYAGAEAVLFEPEGLRGHPPPRREAGKVAPTLPSRSTGGGGLGTDFDCDGGVIAQLVANPLTARMHKGVNTTAGEGQTMVAHTLKGEGLDASEDGTGRGTPLVPVAFNSREDPDVSGEIAGPLGAGSPQAQAIAIQERAVSENPDAGPDGIGVRDDGASYTLEARTVPQAVAFDTTQVTSPGNYSNPKPGYPCHPIAAAAHAPAVAFDMRGREGGAMPEGPHDTANIRAASSGSSRSYVAQPYAVRRLTPTECERLQGFPDGWTQIPYRNKPAENCPDGPRYKALGNSWAVNCGELIFDRIKEVEEMIA